MKKDVVDVENPSMSNVCWSCKKTNPSLLCEECHKVQPPLDLNAFGRFDVDPHPVINQEALEKKYLMMQTMLHPDRFVSKSKEEQVYAQQQSESFNNAFAVLKDSTKCLELLLEKETLPPDDSETLMLVMDLYEKVHTLKQKKDLVALEQEIFAQKEAVLRLCIDAFEQSKKQDLLTGFKKLQFFEKILTNLKEKIRQNS